MQDVTITIKGKEMVRKTVKKHGDGGHIYLSKAWIGKEVVVVLEE